MAHTPLTIRNDTELAAALARADDLLDREGDDAKERELSEIVAAIDAYTDSMKVLRGVSDNPHETSNVTAAGVGEE